MKTAIIAGLDKEDKEEIEQAFLASARLRKRLSDILEGRVENARKEIRKVEGYENPAWPYRQADMIGYERAIYEVISLLSSKTE